MVVKVINNGMWAGIVVVQRKINPFQFLQKYVYKYQNETRGPFSFQVETRKRVVFLCRV